MNPLVVNRCLKANGPHHHPGCKGMLYRTTYWERLHPGFAEAQFTCDYCGTTTTVRFGAPFMMELSLDMMLVLNTNAPPPSSESHYLEITCDAGHSWTTPVTVDIGDDSITIGLHAPPKPCCDAAGRRVAAWYENHFRQMAERIIA